MVLPQMLVRYASKNRYALRYSLLFFATFLMGILVWREALRSIFQPADRSSQNVLKAVGSSLTFLPVRDVYMCANLRFPAERGAEQAIEESVQGFVAVLNAARSREGRTESVEGCRPPPTLTRLLQAVAPLPFVSTACLLSLGAGYHPYTLLSASPKLKIIIFQLAPHIYTKKLDTFFKVNFSKRHYFVANSSAAGIKRFSDQTGVTCDLWVLGGCHRYTSPHAGEITAKVFNSLMPAINHTASRHNMIIVDEIESLYSEWERAKETYNISQHLHCKYFDGSPLDRGIAMGTFNRESNQHP